MDNPYASPSSNPRPQDSWDGQGGITQRVAAVMRSTQMWARIVAITGFIGAAMSLVTILRAATYVEPSRIGGQVFGLIISLALASKLMAYAGKIGVLLQSGRAVDLEAALREHRKYWKIIGVLTLVAVVFVLLVGVFSAMNAGPSPRFR